MSESCENCRFWEEWQEADAENNRAMGICRRHAPRPRPFCLDNSGNSFPEYTDKTEWPNTFEDNWCGEWQAKRVPLPVVDMGQDILEAFPESNGIDAVWRSMWRAENKNRKGGGYVLATEYKFTVGDLVRRSERDILRLHGVGPASLNDVRAALAKHGLKLKGD